MSDPKVVLLASAKKPPGPPKRKRNFNKKRSVTLISGGPAMTIESQDGLGVHCVWLDDVGGIQRDSFLAETLVYFEENEIVFTPEEK